MVKRNLINVYKDFDDPFLVQDDENRGDLMMGGGKNLLFSAGFAGDSLLDQNTPY